MWKVTWSKKVEKQLDKVPDYIASKFRDWAVAVEVEGCLRCGSYPDSTTNRLRANVGGNVRLG